MSDSLLILLSRAVEKYPEKIAISHGLNSIQYRTLWSKISAVSNKLSDLGVSKGDRVALLLDNSIEFVIAYYSVLAIGGVVVALNTATKSRDLVNWIKHSESNVLFANSGHPELSKIVEAIPNLKIILADETEAKIKNSVKLDSMFAQSDQKIPEIELQGDDLATIIYTSGTTGKPKGVMLSHKNLYHNISSILEYLNLNSDDSILNVLPFYYSYGNSVLHTHLAVGGRVILENNVAFPNKILKSMEQGRVTGFSGVPSTFALLMNRTKLGDFDLSSLRYMTQAGGAMAPSNIERLIKELPDIDFYVMYGQTEGTARLAYLPPRFLEVKRGSIGKAIPGIKLEIHDKNGKKCNPHVTGEICAKGDNIMLGYWQDPEATKSVIQNGWLKTGDLAHYDDDGFIYIDGRSSDMIKSGANRISPKEIEEVIMELDEVSEVAVIGVDDEMLGQIIKAVIVLKGGQEINKMQLLSHCRENLANYKVPKLVEFVDSLPKTPSGKVKRFMLK
jgi:acyl-CoA synthetase (AMP-forming)/AMP-acid ligase II